MVDELQRRDLSSKELLLSWSCTSGLVLNHFQGAVLVCLAVEGELYRRKMTFTERAPELKDIAIVSWVLVWGQRRMMLGAQSIRTAAARGRTR